MTEPGSLLGQVFEWVTFAALIALISLVASYYWERRKLARSERIKAYSSFRSSVSRWSKEIGLVGAIVKRSGFSEDDSDFKDAKMRVMAARDDVYDAYAQVEMVAPRDVVAAAYSVLTMCDAHYRAFFGGGKGVPSDRKAEALAGFTAAARKDLGVNKIKKEMLKERKYKSIGE